MPTEHFTRQLPALYNGVSQQPATVRLPSQAEGVVNCLQSVVDGTRKRPPSQNVARLSEGTFVAPFLHTINRDTDNRFTVVILDGNLRVFDMDGEERIVSFPAGASYLASDNPRHDFACITVADYTFIVNKSAIVQMEGVAADQTAQPSNYYWLNRQQAGDYSYGDGNVPMYQYPPNPTVASVTGSVQTFQDLPKTPTNGQLYQIKGNSESNFSSYYVVRKAGVWEETVLPGLKNRINATTMPHALVRQNNGTFIFAPFSWAPRCVGDEVTNPNPTFVGRTIRDITFAENRLLVISDENHIWSAAGDFGNFYRKTVTDDLVDAPIDSSVPSAKVSLLNFVLPFNSSVMLFSDQTQFVVSRNPSIGTASMSLSCDVATEYECSKLVRPAALGANAYFGSENGDYVKVWEYFVREDGVATDAADITAHCPKYIPAGLSKLATSSEHDQLVLLTDGLPNGMFVYRMYWQVDEKAQSSWSRWEFETGDVVINAELLDDFIYTVTQRADGVWLDRIHLQSGAKTPGLPFDVLLDRRCEVQGVYLPEGDQTEFTLPYPHNENTRIVLGGAFETPGALLDPTLYVASNEHSLRVPGNHSEGTCWAGQKYSQVFEFSEQFVLDQNGVAVNTGRLQLRAMTVYFVDTAYFKTVVDPYKDGSQTEVTEIVPALSSEFTAKTIGSSALVVGSPVFQNGAYTFQLYAPATSARIQLVNDSHVNSTFQKAEIEMFYFNRSRR